MRRSLAVCLFVSPLLFPAAAIASPPAHDASASTQDRRSTGVVPPQIVDKTNVVVPAELYTSFPADSTVHLKLIVDRQGKPENIQVVRTSDPLLDQPVINAVRQFSWEPATLDHQIFPADVNLEVTVQH